jgi:hypothetical protein
MDIRVMKLCTVCHKSKSLDHYYRSKSTGKYLSRCKECRRSEHKKKYERIASDDDLYESHLARYRVYYETGDKLQRKQAMEEAREIAELIVRKHNGVIKHAADYAGIPEMTMHNLLKGRMKALRVVTSERLVRAAIKLVEKRTGGGERR